MTELKLGTWFPVLDSGSVKSSRNKNDSDVFSYLRPVLLLNSILGIISPRQERLLLFWLHTVFVLIGMAISCVYNIVDTVEEFYDSFEAFQILMSCIAFVVLAAAKSSTLGEAVECLHRVDLALLSAGFVFRYESSKLHRKLCWRLFLVFLVCVFDAYSYSILPWTLDGVANIFSYYYFYFLFDLVQLQYSVLVNIVGEHFSLINNKIVLLWEDLVRSDIELPALLYSHSDLCEISDLLHEYFSQQLFFISAFVFCNNTSHAYCMISTINSMTSGEPAAGEEEEGPRWAIFALRGVFILFRIIELYWVIIATTFLEEQASKSFEIIPQLMVLEKRPIKNIYLDLHLSMKQKVDMWACGCFKMDNALLLTMLSAATTYIMVLIQYAPEKQPEFNVIKGEQGQEHGNYTAM